MRGKQQSQFWRSLWDDVTVRFCQAASFFPYRHWACQLHPGRRLPEEKMACSSAPWRSVSPICPPGLDAAWVTPDRASTGKWAGSCRRHTPFLSFSARMLRTQGHVHVRLEFKATGGFQVRIHICVTGPSIKRVITLTLTATLWISANTDRNQKGKRILEKMNTFIVNWLLDKI